MEKCLAFVLGGGGARGALQVGAFRALFEAGYQPDLLVGTSIGAVNAAGLAIVGRQSGWSRRVGKGISKYSGRSPDGHAWEISLACSIGAPILHQQASEGIPHRCGDYARFAF